MIMRWFRKLQCKIKVARTPKTGRIINMWDHNGWGNSVRWFDWDKRHVYGHLQNRPKVGDELRCEMESGQIARFLFTSVELQTNPNDMFFAYLTDIGYAKEGKVPEVDPDRKPGEIRFLRT